MTNLKELKTVVDFLGVGDTPQRADVIFVFGHYVHDIPLHAAALYVRGFAPHVLIAGRKTRYLPEDVPTEARYFKEIMMAHGIPEQTIILEERSTNTLEDVVMGMETLAQKGIVPKRVLLIGYVPLLRRAKATFAKHFPGVEAFVVPYAIADLEDTFWLQDRLLRMLLEFDRLKEFADKGDIAPTVVPQEVQEAAVHIKENLPKPPTTQLS